MKCNALTNRTPAFYNAHPLECHFIEITKKTPEMHSGGSYIRKVTQLGNNGNVASGYHPTPKPAEQEPEASLSRSSSLEGIWPTQTNDVFVKRKSTTGMSTYQFVTVMY